MTISANLHRKLDRLAIEQGITLMIAYGSTMTDTRHQDSDLDIAILTRSRPDYHDFTTLYHELSTLFPHEQVDIRFLNDADPLFALLVVQNGQLLAGRATDFVDFQVLVNRRYIDDGRKYFPFRDELLRRHQEESTISVPQT